MQVTERRCARLVDVPPPVQSGRIRVQVSGARNPITDSKGLYTAWLEKVSRARRAVQRSAEYGAEFPTRETLSNARKI